MGLIKWRIQWAGLILGLPIPFILPHFISPSFQSVVVNIYITAIAVLGLNVMLGYAGEIVLAQGAFMAVGAYSTSQLLSKFPALGLLPTVVIGGLITAFIAMFFALPSLRAKGFYVAIATLALQFIAEWFFSASELEWIHGGKRQILPTEPSLIGGFLPLKGELTFYYLTFVILLVVAVIAFNLRRTAIGRAFRAIFQNDLAAGVLGVEIFRNKVLAFAIGGFMVGMAGGLYAFYLGFIDSSYFTITLTLDHYVMLLFGGLGRVWGALVGTVSISLLLEGIRDAVPVIADLVPGVGASVLPIRLLIFGSVIIVTLAIEPRGVLALLGQIKEYLRKWPYSY
jgi:branched-chain amino acid transport system permease protein